MARILVPLAILIGVVLLIFGKAFEVDPLTWTGAIIGLSGLLAGYIWLAKDTDFIRDKSTAIKKPYSLSKTQLAFWSFIVIVCVVFIWIKTNILPPLEGSTLILLGISIGTSVGATIIDFGDSGVKRHQDDPSAGFLKDILSNKDGISVHRFQMVIWTVVLAMIFVSHALGAHELKDFHNNYLALMGISNGAYLGLKIPENK
jgi:hypothetical protein